MRSLTAALVVVLASPVALAVEPAAAEIGDLVWLAGHWRGVIGSATVEEGWLGPSGGTMIGINRTVAGETTVGLEYLRLEERDAGLVLVASPDGRCPPTEFVLVVLDGQRAVFANPEHDFPQRIVYRRDGDRLHASIEGEEGGEPKKIGWVFELQP
jgi:hypothetical protein